MLLSHIKVFHHLTRSFGGIIKIESDKNKIKMSFFSEKIKELQKTQVIAKDLILDDLVKDNILKELKEKFSEDGEIVATYIRFHIIPKEKELKEVKLEKGEKILIEPITLDFIILDHPSPAHFRERVVVITSNKNKILEKFLK